MGRNKKYSTEQLIGYIRQYLTEKRDFTKLKPYAVAKYCNEILHVDPPIPYQRFQGDPAVTKWIEDYNERLDQRVVRTDSGSLVVPTHLFDADRAIRSLGAGGNEKVEQKIRGFITEVNSDLSALMEKNRQLKEQYDKECSKTKALTAQLETQKGRIASMQENMHSGRKGSAKEAAQLKSEIRELKSMNARYREFIEDHFTKALIREHLHEIGMIKDPPGELPLHADEAVSAAPKDDLREDVTRYFDNQRKSDDPEPDPDSPENVPEDEDSQSGSVMTAEEADLYDKFSKL